MISAGRTRRLVVGLVLGSCLYLLLSQLWGTSDDGPRGSAHDKAMDLPARVAPQLRAASGRGVGDVPESRSVDSAALTVRVVMVGGRAPQNPVAYTIGQAELGVPAETATIPWSDHEIRVTREAMRERVLIVTAQGAVPAQATWDQLSAQAVAGVATLELSTGKVISGIVQDPWGRPIPGARVRALGLHGHDVELMHESSELPGPGAVCDLVQTQTDGEGRFELAGVSGFPIDIIAHKAQYMRDLQREPLRVHEGSAEDVKLVLQPLLRLGIQLADAETGQPLQASSTSFKFPRGVYASPQPLAYGGAQALVEGVQAKTGAVWRTLRVTSEFEGDPRAGFDVSVIAQAPYYESKEVVVRSSPRAKSEPVRVSLRRAHPFPKLVPMAIEVRSVPGLVVPAAVLKLSPTDRRFGGPFIAQVELDEKGAGVMHLPPGRYGVEVMPSSAGPWWKSKGSAHAQVTLDEHEGGTLSVDLSGGIAEVALDTQTNPFYEVALFRKRRGRYVPQYYSSSLVMRVGPSMREYRAAFPPSRERFLLPLPPGPYMVVVTPKGQPAVHGEFEVPKAGRVLVPLKPVDGR